jgi:hypothetical protein
MMINRKAAWLESAGVSVPRKPDGKPDCVLEIHPSFAISKEDVKEKAHRISPIKPGSKVHLE